MQKTRPLTCCVCGASAGCWQQHANRDTGLLAVDFGRLILAALADKGVPA